jgi:hypothetical protein
MTTEINAMSTENILFFRGLPYGQDRHRVRRLLVHPGLFLSAIRMGTDGNRYTVDGLPDDAEVVDATFDDFTRTIELLVHSAAFTPVSPFSIVPVLDVRITRHEPEAQQARREPEQPEPADFATMMVILRDVNEKRKSLLRRLFERQGVPQDVTEAVLKEIAYDEALEEDIIRNGGTETAHSRVTADDSIKVDVKMTDDELRELSEAAKAGDIEGYMLRELEKRMGEIYADEARAEEDLIMNGNLDAAVIDGIRNYIRDDLRKSLAFEIPDDSLTLRTSMSCRQGEGPQGVIVVNGETNEETIMVADHDGTMIHLKESQADFLDGKPLDAAMIVPIGIPLADINTVPIRPDTVVIRPDMTPKKIELARQQVSEILATFGSVSIMLQTGANVDGELNQIVGFPVLDSVKLTPVPGGVEFQLARGFADPIPAEPAIDTPIIR